jgi:hypothetical protein
MGGQASAAQEVSEAPPGGREETSAPRAAFATRFRPSGNGRRLDLHNGAHTMLQPQRWRGVAASSSGGRCTSTTSASACSTTRGSRGSSSRGSRCSKSSAMVTGATGGGCGSPYGACGCAPCGSRRFGVVCAKARPREPEQRGERRRLLDGEVAAARGAGELVERGHTGPVVESSAREHAGVDQAGELGSQRGRGHVGRVRDSGGRRPRRGVTRVVIATTTPRARATIVTCAPLAGSKVSRGTNCHAPKASAPGRDAPPLQRWIVPRAHAHSSRSKTRPTSPCSKSACAGAGATFASRLGRSWPWASSTACASRLPIASPRSCGARLEPRAFGVARVKLTPRTRGCAG